MINNLIDRDGWRVHETIHHVFSEYLDHLYDALDRPLHFYLLTLNLHQDLWQHMKFEESCVLPAYAERVNRYPTSGKPEHFHADHNLIRHYLNDLSALSLHAAFEPLPPALLRQATARLDNLLEHHDERETDYLYPALHAVLDEHDRTALLERMRDYRLVGPDRVLAYQNQLLGAAPVVELSSRYRAWLALRDRALEPTDPLLDEVVDEPLLPSLNETGVFPPSLLKLLTQTIKLTVKFATAQSGETRGRMRDWAHAERVVDQAWRSTIAFAIGEANKHLSA